MKTVVQEQGKQNAKEKKVKLPNIRELNEKQRDGKQKYIY